MNRLILKLGLVTLTVLPVVAVASCSSTTPETPSITTEAAKYENKTFAVKGSSTIKTASEAANSISNASTPTDKWTALQNLVTLNIDSANFTYEVVEAKVGSNNTVDVSMKISEKGNTSNSKTVKFTINGFTTIITQEEIDRLATTNLVDKEVLPAKKNETAAQASEAITDLETLGQYYTLTPLPEGLKYVYVSDTLENETVKVVAQVASSAATSTTTPAEKTFIISGFKTEALIELEKEAEKLIDKTSIKVDVTARQAKAAITNDGTLNQYYTPIQLTTNFGYTYGGKTEIDKDNNTILHVTLKVINRNVNPNIELIKVIKLSGFKSPTAIETEALKFDISLPVTKEGTSTMGVVSVINAIDDNQTNKLTALKAYVTNFPEVGNEYTLSIGFAAPDARVPSSVNIPITISPKTVTPPTRNAEAVSPVVVTFTITDLTVESPQQQLDTIGKLLNDRKVLDAKKEETAAQAQKLLINDGALNQYYQRTILPSGFGNNYGLKSEVDKTDQTTLNVTLKITNRNVEPNLVIYKVVKISGFKAATEFEKDAQKFAISAPTKTPEATTSAVITAINNTATEQTAKLEALKSYVSSFPATDGFGLNIGTAVVDPTTATSVMVPITVSKTVTGSETAPASVLVNFIIAGLALPE